MSDVTDLTITDLRARLAAAEATIAELRGALAPFAWDIPADSVNGNPCRFCQADIETHDIDPLHDRVIHQRDCPTAVARALLADPLTDKGKADA